MTAAKRRITMPAHWRAWFRRASKGRARDGKLPDLRQGKTWVFVALAIIDLESQGGLTLALDALASDGRVERREKLGILKAFGRGLPVKVRQPTIEEIAMEEAAMEEDGIHWLSPLERLELAARRQQRPAIGTGQLVPEFPGWPEEYQEAIQAAHRLCKMIAEQPNAAEVARPFIEVALGVGEAAGRVDAARHEGKRALMAYSDRRKGGVNKNRIAREKN